MTELVFVPIVGAILLVGTVGLLLWRAIPARKAERPTQQRLPLASVHGTLLRPERELGELAARR